MRKKEKVRKHVSVWIACAMALMMMSTSGVVAAVILTVLTVAVWNTFRALGLTPTRDALRTVMWC